jgi:hypothetical protein
MEAVHFSETSLRLPGVTMPEDRDFIFTVLRTSDLGTVFWDVIVSSELLANIFQTTRRHILYCKNRENLRCKALITFVKRIKWLVLIILYYYNFCEEKYEILNIVT